VTMAVVALWLVLSNQHDAHKLAPGRHRPRSLDAGPASLRSLLIILIRV